MMTYRGFFSAFRCLTEIGCYVTIRAARAHDISMKPRSSLNLDGPPILSTIFRYSRRRHSRPLAGKTQPERRISQKRENTEPAMNVVRRRPKSTEFSNFSSTRLGSLLAPRAQIVRRED